MRWPVALLLLASFSWQPDPAHAAVPAGDNVDRPCLQFSPELEAAEKQLETVDKLIGALAPRSNHKKANDALIELASHPCMVMAHVRIDQLRAEAAPALTDFWTNGGKLWVEGQLGLLRGRTVVFPPLMRKVVSRETRATRALYCPLGDMDCGAGARGWWQRAEAYFTLNAKAQSLETTVLLNGRIDSEKDCESRALGVPARERYTVWEHCVEPIRAIGFSMPLGGVKVPESGWLVLRGRRGHYTFCDEVRMYSLATGASYISQSCNGALFWNGGVAPDSGRKVLRGTVPVDNIRELAWMLLQLDESAEGFTRSRGFYVPPGFELLRVRDDPGVASPAGAPALQEFVRSGKKLRMVSSGQTTLAWAITSSQGEEVVSGNLTWPNDMLGGPNDHAAGLVGVAEGGFIEGCPKEKLPGSVGLSRAAPKVSAVDANARVFSEGQARLVTDLHKALRAACTR